MSFGIIYCLTNEINGKQYIGQTITSLEERWESHVSMSKSERRKQMVVTRAIAKHGEETFSRTILKECLSQEELDINEVRLIKELKTMVPNGYNVREGGWGGKLSEETKRKISLACKGKKLSLETRALMSKRMTGTHLSEETKNKISEKAKGRPTWNSGKTMTEEHRQNISKAKKGRLFSEEHKQKLREARAKFFETRTQKKDAEILSPVRATIEEPTGD